MQAAKTIVIRQVIAPRLWDEDDVYFSAFDAETGEKVAPWADADTAEEVMENLQAGNAGV